MLSISSSAQVDLNKCLRMLESREEIPCPWQQEDYSLYDAAWRKRVSAMAEPPPRYPHTGVKVDQYYMIKADLEHENSDPNQRFWIGRIVEELLDKDKHQCVRVQWVSAEKEFGKYRQLSAGFRVALINSCRKGCDILRYITSSSPFERGWLHPQPRC